MTEAPTKRRRLSHDARRALILEQACALFAQKNYNAVSMEQIAAAAGVTRGLLNHYFGTKRDLYLDVVRHLTRLPPKWEQQPIDIPIDDVVSHYVGLFLDNAERNRKFWLAQIGGAGFGRDRELERVMNDVEEAYVDRIIEIVGRDPLRVSTTYRATLRGFGAFALAITQQWLVERRISREEAHEILRRTLLAIVRDVAE